MSEVQSRPSAPRGRSSARGGRGGHRGITRSSNKQTNGDRASSTAVDHTADEGELAELKGQYKTQLTTLKELFPDWTDMDLLLGLNDCNGDLEATIERITEGNVSQFSEVHKKTKDRSRSKVKESPAGGDSSATSRGARSRAGQEGTRGTRGRGDRGRGGLRGSRGGTHTTTNGARSTDASVPTTESSAYANNDTEADGVEGTPEGQQDSAPKPTLAKASEAQKAKAVPAEPPKKTWASMFAKPKPAPAPAKPAAQPPVSKEPPKPQPEAPTHDIPVEPVQPEQATAPLIPENVDVPEPTPPPETLEVTDSIQEDVAALELTPSKDQLTEDNVEHLPDVSRPAPTETAASTVASDSVAGIATPLSTSQQAPIGRSALGGYATTAHKATMQQGRSVSYQRRLFEQQEAVVMPGNHAVDRAAVQFGNFKLNGDVESPLDVDEDREEAETRTQPPQHSPTAQPRTSLPPVPRQAQVPAELAAQEPAAPVTKPAPGLPPVPQAQQQPVGAQQSPQNPIATQAMTQQGSQGSQQYSQFGRYNQPGAPTEPAAAQQKQYDPFANQNPQQSQYDNFSGQSQTGNQQQQAQSGLGAYSSAPNDYPSFYTADQRAAYQNYYNAYNQQGSVNQEVGQSQQRSGSAFGSNPTDSTFSTTQAPSGPSRYGETQNSGQNTPNPTGQNQSQSQHMHPQAHTQSGHGAGYAGYNHPYYQSAYYQNYMSQYGGYGNQGFGPYGKGSMYGQPHHGYGMSPQTPYDQHSSSPANAGSFGQSSMHGREGLLGGGFSDYGRSGSTQPSSTGQHSATNAGFSGTSDTFSRTQGGFPGQSQQYGQQQQTNQQASNEESLKPFGESKTSSGPSPALGQPGRPGSATNTASAQANQTGLPPTQSHQQGFGQYPSHLGNQGNQYGALGGLGGHQSGPQNYQAGGYGYGGGFGANQYGNRGGWGANFSGHQNH